MKKHSLIFLIGILLSSCSSKKEVEEPKNFETIEVTDGWARPSKSGMMSAAYFTLKNSTDYPDTLLSISSNASANTQMHESYETSDGLMGMKEQTFIPILAQSEVLFKQGGLHVMIIQPEEDLIEGDSIKLTLKFSSAIQLEVKVPIKSFD